MSSVEPRSASSAIHWNTAPTPVGEPQWRFAPVSLDDPINGRDDATWGDTFTEEDGYLTWIGASANPIPALEGRLSLNRALNTLLPEHLSLCAKLLSTSIGCMDAESGPSRATLYRQVAEIRFCLLAAGIGPQT